MFRNDQQKCQAIMVLLGPCGMAEYWTLDGPTAAAVELLERKGGGHSHGQGLMLRAAFDVWNGDGVTPLSELIAVLDPGNLHMLCSLLICANIANECVDQWIASYGSFQLRIVPTKPITPPSEPLPVCVECGESFEVGDTPQLMCAACFFDRSGQA